MLLEQMTEPELRAVFDYVGDGVLTLLKNASVDSVDGGPNRFVLVVFDDPKIAQYVSSCTRETMILALKQMVERLEAGQVVTR